ncbi:MAG: type II toxin-antitoxin system RelE/ParE family toxin [Nitrospira sp.]|nr:type II toxin-antitoxin system RelE/ParE family toxin [Nitrospira sp.]MDH4369443.1 type II toxin-antitoxin system RelE/ParE family toxin [Nitrospira sp.]MDH5347065.1 type II toxin-antitoxin system RelE/ParE family toxin [Nitrospira sp.]MDH5496368.1 type II toxin-antitoxin system RelE/ParE family toxin [Nitrospira sp.]MDH5724070.1 type II toxin-antitoxin system RelE/ParE family toxin [Nitrospira sp.]
MARRLVVQPQADLDIQAAAVWYEDQRSGLGVRFLDELGLVFQRIETNPRQFSRLEGEVRRALLHHFPYGVYFIEVSEAIIVLAVLHLHRDPDVWKSRN